MEKLKAPKKALKKVVLNATQIALAQQIGMDPVDYAKQLLKLESQPTSKDSYAYDPNDVEIMNVPIATLKNMWLVRYGYRWVEEYSFEEDDVWSDIFERLNSHDLFEACRDWMKLKEEL